MAFIELIHQAHNLEALQELFGRKGIKSDKIEKKKTDINILNLSDPVNPNKKNTIKFRQHAGVTRPQEALAWIDFVQTLVQFAHDQSPESIESACERAATEPDLTLEEFFNLLGVSAETQAYYINRTSKCETSSSKGIHSNQSSNQKL